MLPPTKLLPPFAAGLFASASSAAASPFSFSAPVASQPAQQVSLFGAVSQPAQATPLFGGGATASAIMPVQQPQQQQQLTLSAALELSDAVRAVDGIASSYSPGNPRCRFQHLLLNVVDAPAAHVKPTCVDELQWREALQRAGGPDNPDHLWPVLAQGFRDLLARWAVSGMRRGGKAGSTTESTLQLPAATSVQAPASSPHAYRKAAQDEAIQEQDARLEALKQTAAVVASRQEALIKEQLEGIRRRHVQLCEQLLHVLRYVSAKAECGLSTGPGACRCCRCCRCAPTHEQLPRLPRPCPQVDALEGRFAQAMGARSSTPKELMQQLSCQLAELEDEVAPAMLAGRLHTQIEALGAAAQLQARRVPPPRGPDALEGAAGLDGVYACLQQYADALAKLQEVVQRDAAVLSCCEQV